MKRLLLLLAASLLLGPSTLAQQVASSPVVLYRTEARRGGAVEIGVLGEGPLADLGVQLLGGAGKIVSAARGFALDAAGRRWWLLLSLPSTLEGGDYVLELPGGGPGGPFRYQGSLRVAPVPFPTERIRFNQGLSRLLTQPDPQKEAELARLREALEEFRPDSIWHTGTLRLPLQGARQTSAYADRRQYLYADGGSSLSLHNGVDLAAPEGTQVAACASGRVVLAAERMLTGWSVVIEHLPGVYSLYFHLSRLWVEEGQRVRAGELIGTVGSPGVATGPHLHWELRVNGQPVDPQAFLGRPLVDKSWFSSIMDEPSGHERR